LRPENRAGAARMLAGEHTMSDDPQGINVPNPLYEEAARRAFDTAAFVSDVGIRLVKLGPGWVETELDVLPRHFQNTGTVHAGVQATMADHSAGTAATTVVAQDEYVLSANFNLSLLRPATGDKLRCRAAVLKSGRRLVVVESEVYSISGGKSTLLSKATVTLAVLRARETEG
jgi:uncharacterized protein (TIGR00369 family)